MTAKTLRLLITSECNKNCEGCCNKQYDLNTLPKITHEELSEYDEIIVTGGEPTFAKDELRKVMYVLINTKIKAKKYLYTNGYDPALIEDLLLLYFDGITFSLHEQSDVEQFLKLNKALEQYRFKTKSLRLNVFKGIILPDIDLSKWQIKKDIIWLDPCPLPENESFKRFF